MRAFLILEDGTVLEGIRIGAEKEIISEIVFNTSMAGYPEVLTDPSYAPGGLHDISHDWELRGMQRGYGIVKAMGGWVDHKGIGGEEAISVRMWIW